MFDKMVKMRNKKAFTLVEMLVVIAIIAILVAIVVPIVGKSTTKARAATNAANLRAVEGQLSTVRVSNPDLFTDVVEDFGQYLSTIDQFKDVLGKLDVTGWGGWIVSSLGLDSQVTLKAYKLCHFTDEDKDGTIEIKSENGNSYTLTGIPLSVAVSAGGTVGMEVPEGTPMTIWISENGIVATYETTSGAYVNANFAEVAETGEFNSRPSGGDTEQTLTCAAKGHKKEGVLGFPGDSYIENCVCTNCGATVHQATGDTHLCDCRETLIHKEHDADTSLTNIGEIIEIIIKGESISCKYCSAKMETINCGSKNGFIYEKYSETNGVCNKCKNNTADHKILVGVYYYYYKWSDPVPTPST